MNYATGEDKRAQERLVAAGEIPAHIAIIMDGNGRWARQRSLPRIAGHRAGVKSVRDIVEACGQLGVKFLTLYAFSTENWKRPAKEVSVLMGLLVKYLKDEIEELRENDVRLEAIGQLNSLPKNVQHQLFDTIDALNGNRGLVLNLALSYSGRSDLARAFQMLAFDIRRGKISPEDIDEGTIRPFLATASMPDPDLLIRTSGEKRISNFMLWESAYSEIVFNETYWPDFRRTHLYEAIADYQTRERRFGRTSEQSKEPRPSYVRRMLNAIVG